MLGDFTASLPSYLNLVTGASGSSFGGNSDGGIDWGNILTGAISTGESILKNQFGTPNLQPGTYLQSGPNGNLAYRLPDTNTASFGINTFPGITSTANPLILVGVGILGIIVLVKALGK